MNNTKARGFTLIELLIVIAIVAILGGIGYPAYVEQVEKARRTDARSALMLVALAQERFFTTNGTYAPDLDDDNNPAPGLGLPDFLQDNGQSEEGYYLINLARNNNTFTVTAVPNPAQSQTGDEECTSFTINQLGLKTATGAPKEGTATDFCW